MDTEVLSLIIGIIDLVLIGLALNWINIRSADKDAAEILRLNNMMLKSLEKAGLAEYIRDNDDRIVSIIVRLKSVSSAKAYTSGDLSD